ncbi:protein HEADING DATE 3A-like [Phoenix dactylifera]|uniref:Protein HEADING DATE 3A-like n=1 Tax=Phoenix dactylifera TaxID=42345 RepID=A0A8B7BKV2_PHODC|nr:protein HEADING DATE 3A-like [Phoenix dactylifera]XP_038986283.1 protein HEADING DATE 3A-like [Phoenix dactylifera]
MSGDALTLGKVVGDVVDQFPRTVPLKIFYNNRLLFNGAGLKPSAVVNRPSVDVGGDDLRTFYTLVMVDPDAPNPSNPTLREYLHWMVTDIPGSTDTNFGRELTTYESPGPAFGIHRMVFALFHQLGRETVFATPTRNNFNTRDFAQENHLGLPVAAAYFNCQREGGCGGRRF